MPLPTTPRLRTARAVAAALLMSLFVAGCGGAATPVNTSPVEPPATPAPEPLPPAKLYTGDQFVPALARRLLGTCYRFTDDTREGRRLSVQVRVPTDAQGPRPVIVFSHGAGARDECSFVDGEWGTRFATAGYVVVHIAHSLTDAEQQYACDKIGIADCSEIEALGYLRPGDISAVISELPQIASAFGITAQVDTTRIGMAGHSLGAYTAMVVSGAKINLGVLRGQSFADPRIVSTLALSPQGPDIYGFYDNPTQGNSWQDMKLPVMIQTGAGDSILGGAVGEQAVDRRIPFTKLPAPDKIELYLADDRAEHLTFDLVGNAPASFMDWISSGAIAWFDATLQGRAEARRYLASDDLTRLSDGLEMISRKSLTPP